MSRQQDKKVIVAYGFEYNALIGSPQPLILCKCFESHNPFYAMPKYIESTNIHEINRQIEAIEDTENEMMKRIKTMASRRYIRYIADDIMTECTPCWRTVIYYEDIKFNHLHINYESEGDENGDGR